MDINFNQKSKLFYGTEEIKKVYNRDTLLWEKQHQLAPKNYFDLDEVVTDSPYFSTSYGVSTSSNPHTQILVNVEGWDDLKVIRNSAGSKFRWCFIKEELKKGITCYDYSFTHKDDFTGSETLSVKNDYKYFYLYFGTHTSKSELSSQGIEIYKNPS